MSKVAVLMPNYNNGPYLKEALDSIFAQTYQDFIIYFVDDCSQDNSVAIASKYDQSRIRIIQKQTNSGIVDTMNIGLNLIETPYFIRMDGDDISTPDRFERLIRFMNENPEIGVCSSDILTFGKYDQVLTYCRDPKLNQAHLVFGHKVGHASSIFRTEILKKNQISYRNDFWRMEDYQLFYELKDVTKITSIFGTFYHYRRGDYNDNQTINHKKIKEFRNFYSMVLSDLGLEATPHEVEIHLQLSRREKPTFQFQVYNDHIKKLKKKNEEKGTYPVKELSQVLDEQLRSLVFSLIDKKLVSLPQLFRHYWNDKMVLPYFLKLRLKRKRIDN